VKAERCCDASAVPAEVVGVTKPGQLGPTAAGGSMGALTRYPAVRNPLIFHLVGR